MSVKIIYIQHNKCINSWWLNDSIYWQQYWSTLAQGIACCLTARSHYLKQWRRITVVCCGINLRVTSNVLCFNKKMLATFCSTGGIAFLTATSLNCLITNLWMHDRNTTSIIQDTISRLLRQYPACWHKATCVYKGGLRGSYSYEYLLRQW